MSKNVVDLITLPQEYFHTCLRDAQKILKLQINENIECYLTNLLCEFIDPSKLYDALGEENTIDTPLAFILQRALETEGDQQVQMFKLLGDTSLYVAGYFQDYFNRKIFDVGYYIDMGTSAYDLLSGLVRDESNVYGQLSESFVKLVDVLGEIATMSGFSDNKNILAVYDRWVHTNSNRLYKILMKLGIEPIPSNLKQAQ